MPIGKLLTVINDFSSGEVDTDLKRGAGEATASGGRQMSNWRVLNSRKKANRPGRSALFFEAGPRVEEVLMSPGNKFFLVFGNGYLNVYNAAGTRVFNTTVRGDGLNIPWGTANVGDIVWTVTGGTQYTIYIFYTASIPDNVPQVLTWDGVSQTSTWTIANFSEFYSTGGQKRTAFYRISPQNVTMTPSATTGNITLGFSSSVLQSGHVGTRMRYCNRQVLITAVPSGNVADATVIEPLPNSQQLTIGTTTGSFAIGDLVEGSITGTKGVVITAGNTQALQFNISFNNYAFGTGGGQFGIGTTFTGQTSGATGIIIAESVTWNVVTSTTGFVGGTVIVQIASTLFQAGESISWGSPASTVAGNSGWPHVGGTNFLVQPVPTGQFATYFAINEIIAGPSGSGTVTAISPQAPQAVSVWDDEVMNNFRGWPLSGFYDQGRLGLCNIPALPGGIAWSAIGLYNDFYPDASSADNAIFEIAPGKSQVLYVQPGMESSEFVFCDNAIYYIPISQAQPLAPGSVAFNLLSEEGCYPNVQPRAAEQTILYIKAGGLQVGAVQAPGAYYRPYVVDVVSEFHAHLFTASPPIAIAVPSASSQFQELYAYILLANGSIVMGRYAIRQGLLDVGSEGKPKIGWMPWTGAGTVVGLSALGSDLIFATTYGFPGGASGIVEILDNTQYLDGAVFVNNLPAAMAPPTGKGPLYWLRGGTVYLIDLGTRFMGTYNIDANGWIIPNNEGGENLNSTQLVAGQPWTAVYEPFLNPAPGGQDQQQGTRRRKIIRAAISVENSSGFVWGQTRIPAYFVGDNAEIAAILREYTYRFRLKGRDFDPRGVLQKDTPGPLTVVEHRIRHTA